jgi:hypothetical protein
LQIFGILTYFFELLPFLLCSIFLKRICTTQEGKAFFVYTALYGLIIILVLFFRYYLDNRAVTAILKRLAIVIEFTILCTYFNQIIINRNIKRVLPLAVFMFVVLACYDYYTSVERVISFMPLVIECLFFILLIVYFFYEKVQFSLLTPIYLAMSFWISTGFIIYFSGNFFLFLYSKAAVKDDVFKMQYNLVYNFFTILKNILLSVGIIIHNPRNFQNDNISIQPDLNNSLDPFSVYRKSN